MTPSADRTGHADDERVRRRSHPRRSSLVAAGADFESTPPPILAAAQLLPRLLTREALAQKIPEMPECPESARAGPRFRASALAARRRIAQDRGSSITRRRYGAGTDIARMIRERRKLNFEMDRGEIAGLEAHPLPRAAGSSEKLA